MSNLASIEENDKHFGRDLRISRQAVWRVAQWLGDMGYEVKVPPTHERPSIERRDEYADNGDLFIRGRNYTDWVRVEVKRRISCSFSADGQFQYDTLIVDAAHCWDRAEQKPIAYVIVNSPMTACAIVKAASSEKWSRTERWDRLKSRMRQFYECPVSEVKFLPLPNAR